MPFDLKDQYFGCEIEMTGLTRRKAAGAVAELFGTTAQYAGGAYGAWEITDREGKKWRLVSDGSIRATRKVNGEQVAVYDRD